MNCRDFRSALRASALRSTDAIGSARRAGRDPDPIPEGAFELSAEAREHRAACPACDREVRAAALLRLGSGLVAGEPRDGFEARLRARIAAEGAAPASATWADGIGLVARPALGVALLAMVAVLAWSGWERSRPSGDDFGMLAGGDAAIDAVLADQVADVDSASGAGGTGSTGNAP